ncbi:MAG: hypothetical protein J4F43_05290 [Dehalococcoidia bacterium]|nr:hypothetical protein [Dehalococcoidia bacterium]
MENILNLSRQPKTLDLERTDDGTLRLVITLKKLGQVSAMEYFLDGDDARKLAEALGR